MTAEQKREFIASIPKRIEQYKRHAEEYPKKLDAKK
jgi:hypothetical protein